VRRNKKGLGLQLNYIFPHLLKPIFMRAVGAPNCRNLVDHAHFILGFILLVCSQHRVVSNRFYPAAEPGDGKSLCPRKTAGVTTRFRCPYQCHSIKPI
jgi:hypothetical protein